MDAQSQEAESLELSDLGVLHSCLKRKGQMAHEGIWVPVQTAIQQHWLNNRFLGPVVKLLAKS